MALTKVGSLWAGFDKNGNEYFNGKLEGLIQCKVVIFKNTPRDGETLHEKAPAFIIFADDGEDSR